MASTTSQIIHKTHLLNHDQMLDYYADWADSYDTDVKSSGYEAPRVCAEALGKVLSDKSALIVDCAAGTGIVGEELKNIGFKTIDAVDYSQQSLDISASKGVYRRLICNKFDENKIEEIKDDSCSALICVGALLMNHITQTAFPEWNRIVKQGGFMVFTLSRVEYDDGLPDHRLVIGNGIQELLDKGTWELIDQTAIPYHSGYLADMFTIRLKNKTDL
ncbi:methyltransferase-like protein 27 isoform X1 [Patiria miniata]|uniref:Methyltransferase type 11 domain-containing protein n=1 Tax=Patiria miniata TaxID=46514 RepID=A0A914BQM3_PATMI|nr:methyltransferase-like protein 27 isoform X1 [Patiria miniata]